MFARQVRGAPLIGVVAALSLAVELQTMTFSSEKELLDHVTMQLEYLITARPTAVNILDTRNRMLAKLQVQIKTGGSSVDQLKARSVFSRMFIKQATITWNHLKLPCSTTTGQL